MSSQGTGGGQPVTGRLVCQRETSQRAPFTAAQGTRMHQVLTSFKCKLSPVLTCLETQRVKKASSRKNKYLLSTYHVPCTLIYTRIHTDTLRLDTPAVLVSHYGCVNRHRERLSNFFEVTQLIGGGARFEPSQSGSRGPAPPPLTCTEQGRQRLATEALGSPLNGV